METVGNATVELTTDTKGIMNRNIVQASTRKL